MNFTQEIVSRLGTKTEPFGWPDALMLFLIVLAVVLIAGIERLIRKAVRRIVAGVWGRISSEFDRANFDNRNDR